ncbi:MAG TPA: hypothetical protein VG099_27350 [Gemmataceae bacterium]|jgi:hypothetical protein|nr:hypothetical protein [Gemmataceae bacterium]
MKADSPIVEEVRGRRMQISSRFDHDLEKYVAHLRDIERQHAGRVVSQINIIRGLSPWSEGGRPGHQS